MLKEQVLSIFIFLRIPKKLNVIILSTIGKTCICPIVEDVTLSLFYKRFSPYPQLLFLVE